MRPELDIQLGVDGSGFEAGLSRLGKTTQGAAVTMGRTLGSSMMTGMLALVGIGAIKRMAMESMRWAKDIEAVKAEYAELGVTIDKDIAQKMVSAGREFARIGMQWRIMWLPVISAMAMGLQAIAQSLKTAWIYWTAMAKGTAGRAKGLMGTASTFYGELGGRMMADRSPGQSFVEKLTQGWNEATKAVGEMPGEVQSFNDILKEAADAVAAYDKQVIEQMTKDIIAMQNIPPKEEKSTVRAGSSATRPGLVGIGGTVGLLEDRVFRIEQEQLRQLKAIEVNTKRTNSGTLQI